jgi:hypothetical protein
VQIYAIYTVLNICLVLCFFGGNILELKNL